MGKSEATKVGHRELRKQVVKVLKIPHDLLGPKNNFIMHHVARLYRSGHRAGACDLGGVPAEKNILVRLIGLSEATRLNGELAVTDAWDAVNERWAVRLASDGSMKNVRPENMTRDGTADLPPMVLPQPEITSKKKQRRLGWRADPKRIVAVRKNSLKS